MASEYKVHDVVLAKIKGFPAWPGIIMDDDDVPAAVRSEKPTNKSGPLYTIRFFPAADYHWATPRDLSHLSHEDIDRFLGSHKKTGDLYKAYKIARDPHEWNAQQTANVRDHDAALAAAEEEEGEEEEEEEEEEVPKKRKQSAQSADRKKQKKAQEVAPKEEEPREEPEEELDPQTKKVREWRHKLQRAFLSKDGVIREEDMEAQDGTFKIIEAYDDITPEQLKVTKIGKVVKRIHQLPEIPKDDVYHFRERASALMARWSSVLEAAAPTDA